VIASAFGGLGAEVEDIPVEGGQRFPSISTKLIVWRSVGESRRRCNVSERVSAVIPARAISCCRRMVVPADYVTRLGNGVVDRGRGVLDRIIGEIGAGRVR
jgi:hypothetical protein